MPIRPFFRPQHFPSRLLFCLMVASIIASPLQAQQPNIVVLVADDLGYGELGCQGNPQIPTPHIDSLANDGVRFTSGYVTAPFCSASRAGLMTGRYQTRFGYEFNPIGHRNEDPLAGLPESVTTLADALVSVGYTTALVGKWHLGAQGRNHPHRRGFDEFFGFLHEGHYFVPPPYRGVTTMLRRRALPGDRRGRWTRGDERLIYSTHMGYNEPDYDANNPILRGGQPVVEDEYLTDAFTREAVDFIDRNAGNPFLLVLSYNAVHSPLQAPDELMQKHAQIEDVHRRIFAGMLSSLDNSVGQVLSKLKQKQLEQNTMVFFLSDNGGPTRELTSSNAPLRGEKGQVYEGGIRVPFLLRWPGVAAAGSVDDRPVLSLDIFATAVAAAGAESKQKLDGVDLRPFLTTDKQATPHPTLYWRTGKRAALRHGDWKLLRNPQRRRTDRWELYNLAEDLGEKRDLSKQAPDQLRTMISRWDRLNSEMMEPIWRP